MEQSSTGGAFNPNVPTSTFAHLPEPVFLSMKRLLLLGCLVLAASLVWAGCDTAEQQNEFEDQAFSLPSGFTRTDRNGEILSEDTDDWRTSPVYSTRVLVDPAFPNPVPPGEFVTIPVQVREFNSVQGGLELVSFDENRIPRRLDDIRDASDPGAYIFTFNPALLGVPGLVRVFILDSRGGLVSYGDLLVEQ